MRARLENLRKALGPANCDAFVSLAPANNQYLTGFMGTTSAVIVSHDEAQFLSDFRYTEQVAEQVASCYETIEIPGATTKAAGQYLRKLDLRRVAFDPNLTSVAEREALEEEFGQKLIPKPSLMNRLRIIKDEKELDLVRQASALAEGAMLDVVEELKPGMTERELAARLEFEFKRRGALGPSFDTIALFGPRSSLPHGMPGDRELSEGDIVLTDFGCRRCGYCSDLTRTFVFGRIPGNWFEEIYALTREAQQQALEAVAPGKLCRDLDAVARDIIREGGYGPFFGHGLGHGVGIEIHEAPRLNHDSETVLRPGMVITIEPGIYVPGKGGVRIEDLVIVTEDGYECLTQSTKDLRILGT